MNRYHQAAIALLEHDFSFIPSYRSRSKAPATEVLPIAYGDDGKPIAGWRDGTYKREWTSFRLRRPTADEARYWFSKGKYNITLVCGKISGNLVVFDFDYYAEKNFGEWKRNVPTAVFDQLTIIETGKGYQIPIRVALGEGEELPKTAVLARMPPIEMRNGKTKDGEVLIELKSEGSLCTTAPSWHVKRKKHYRAIQGSLLSVPVFDLELVEELIARARQLNQAPEKPKKARRDLGQPVLDRSAFGRLDERRARGYARGALRGIGSELSAMAGGRNIALNSAAFSLGKYVGAGLIDIATVEQTLRRACEDNKLIPDDGNHSFEATLRSGLEAGMAEAYTPQEIKQKIDSNVRAWGKAVTNVHPPLTESQQEQVLANIQSIQAGEVWRKLHESLTRKGRAEWALYTFDDFVIDHYYLGQRDDGALSFPITNVAGDVYNIEYIGEQYRTYEETAVPPIHFVKPFFPEDEQGVERIALFPSGQDGLAAHLNFGLTGVTFAGLPQIPIRQESLQILQVMPDQQAIAVIPKDAAIPPITYQILEQNGVRFLRLPYTFGEVLRQFDAEQFARLIRNS